VCVFVFALVALLLCYTKYTRTLLARAFLFCTCSFYFLKEILDLNLLHLVKLYACSNVASVCFTWRTTSQAKGSYKILQAAHKGKATIKKKESYVKMSLEFIGHPILLSVLCGRFLFAGLCTHSCHLQRKRLLLPPGRKAREKKRPCNQNQTYAAKMRRLINTNPWCALPLALRLANAGKMKKAKKMRLRLPFHKKDTERSESMSKCTYVRRKWVLVQRFTFTWGRHKVLR